MSKTWHQVKQSIFLLGPQVTVLFNYPCKAALRYAVDSASFRSSSYR
jgi:hypothetical protein